jgi:hypothetical protein
MPELSAAEHEAVEDWALECFNTLFRNLVNAEQKQMLYPRFGLDPAWVRGAMLEAFTDERRRGLMRQSTDIFRTLIKTLVQSGIVTERTRDAYAAWVDLGTLAAEGDRMVGDDIAEEGIRFLKDVNAGKRKIVRKIGATRP